MMLAREFLSKKPVVLKNDPLPYVRKVMNRWKVFELPVLDEGNVFGTINLMDMLKALRQGINIENLLACHLARKKVEKVEKDSPIEEMAGKFLTSKANTILVFDGSNFLGYVERNEILRILFEEKRCVKEFLSKDFKIVDFDENPRKVIRLVEKHDLLVFKNEKPFIALSKEDCELMNKLIDFLLREKEVERKRSEIKLMKELGIPPISAQTIGRFLKKRIVVKEGDSVGRVARVMHGNRKNVLAVEPSSIVSDLSLLRLIA